MKKESKPSKIDNVCDKARKCISSGLYRYTAHAVNRKRERNITEEDALFVIENGWRNQEKDSFCEEFKTWKYAFEGKNLQEEHNRFY